VGGVNSPVRSFSYVGDIPRFIEYATGPYLVTVDGDRLIDYVLSWGPMILGHAHPDVVAAIQAAATKGTSFGAPHHAETQLACLIQSFFPSMEKIRFVNSGTEACMSAIRLARGVTGRKRLLKFSGCYHGHVDALLVSAGSGLATQSTPDSAGVLPEWAAWTSVLPFNDVSALAQALDAWGHELAGVIVEPVMGNMGLILPQPGFLRALREACDRVGALLIFDEVMTGFRVALGGAQSVYGVVPDLTCLGKVVGGGLPCAAYGGRAVIMDHVAPLGGVYQAGTLSGNPLAMAAGLATLSLLKDTPAFEQAQQATQRLVTGLSTRLDGFPVHVTSLGSMWSIFMCEGPVQNADDAMRVDRDRFATWYRRVLSQGVYLAPSPFESQFVSSVHTEALIDETVAAIVAACDEW